MRPFQCDCGAKIFFENVSCLTCGKELGFAPEVLLLSALEPVGEGQFRTQRNPKVVYTKCENFSTQNACNWLVPSASGERLCRSCLLTRIIPDLSNHENRTRWARIESAKRRLVYTIDRLGLPLESKRSDTQSGVLFDIKADTEDCFVLTGHDDGIVTVRLDEADSVVREKMRKAMNEQYRSLLGHLRHESGHYYFDLLLRDTPLLAEFRKLFGDERADYAAALRLHYSSESDKSLPDFVSHYASSHPWEDWAETWAHYFHMVDTLETAETFGALTGKATTFSELIDRWMSLTILLNALNRSMGLDDAYPFQLSDTVRQKLSFVDQVVQLTRQSRLPIAS